MRYATNKHPPLFSLYAFAFLKKDVAKEYSFEYNKYKESEVIMAKVILLNGSPHKSGSTYTALFEVKNELERCGIEAEIIHIGDRGHVGCNACGGCKSLGRCVIDDGVNEVSQKLDEADGVVIGSPVYYASPNGNLLGFLDRLFFSSSRVNKPMKVGAAVVSARRGGCSATFDALNKYFMISGMPVVSSNYWNMIHGSCAEDAKEDLEGMQTMKMLGRNMAFLIKAIAREKEASGLPEGEKKVYTNFIRR